MELKEKKMLHYAQDTGFVAITMPCDLSLKTKTRRKKQQQNKLQV